jgi:prepilin-type N-terminal cleavage/methylation domain-containing protein
MRLQEQTRTSDNAGQGGFSLLEMLLASAILLVGILSVVQLVPASLKSDLYNRMDTMATTVAQLELDQMVNQLQRCSPQTQILTQNVNACQGINTQQFTDNARNTVALGGATAGSYGAPIVMQDSNPVIDFSASTVSGYNIQSYQNQNDTTGSTFELRWAVIATANSSGGLIAKRIIIGCRHTNSIQPMLPVILDTSVQD